MYTKPTDSQAASTGERAEAPDGAVGTIAAALRGEPVDTKQLTKRGFADTLLEAVDTHGIGPLLHHALKSNGAAGHWPSTYAMR